jgi:oleate hydratase
MKGERIHILEELSLPGGACDGIKDTQKGFIVRGGREMENHFECLWDLFRSIPSLETEGASVLDEYYWLNKNDPNYSLMRATVSRGENAHTDGKFALSDKASMEIMKLFMTRDEDLYDKKMNEVLTEEFFKSNFWLYWRTMFAFEEWHSALEMKLYLQRFIHHIGGLPDFKALKFTKYNQYESLILPMVKYLEAHNVQFQYDTTVTNVIFDIKGNKKVATKILCKHNGREESIDLIEDDLVFITNGSCTENSTLGDDNHAAVMNTAPGGCWELWKNIAKQDPSFGHPEKFCSDIEKTNWESATVTTLDDRIPQYIEKICKRDPFSGKVVTGGIITCKDSKWLLSYTVNRQPHFKEQPKNQLVVWVYSLFTDVPGDYIKKPMKECTGTEIVEEWLYHMGVPEAEIHDMATKSAHCIPCMMPYITAFFMPRRKGDRPNVVPDGCVNAAFLGQFAETARDTIFTTEYSVRTAMEAVYTLLNVDRGVPEVFGSCYDVRALLDATSKMMDGKKLTDMKLPFKERFVAKKALQKASGTVIEDLLKRYNII